MTSTALPLTVVSETATALTVSWTPPAGVAGYEFLRDGARVSSSWDVAVAETTFAVPDGNPHSFAVVALTAAAQGEIDINQPPATPTWESVTAHLDDPIPDLTNAAICTTPAQLAAALANAKAGQVIHATGTFKVPGMFTAFNRVITGGDANPVKVVIDSTVQFVGPYPGQRGYLSASNRQPAVYLHGTAGWRVWGGYITNDNGGGIWFHGNPRPAGWAAAPTPVFKWTGFQVKNTADTCVAIFNPESDVDGVILKGLAGTANPWLPYDPHAEKGTGIHACNIENATYKLRNSVLAIDVLDQATGAAFEVRTDYPVGVTAYIRARHVGFPCSSGGLTWGGGAQSQVAGNVAQLWGNSTVGTLDLAYLEGNNIQGRIVECAGVSSSASIGQGRVTYGVASGPILQNPKLSKVAYNVKGGLVLGVCTPLP